MHSTSRKEHYHEIAYYPYILSLVMEAVAYILDFMFSKAKMRIALNVMIIGE
jgi:hypothetical protein